MATHDARSVGDRIEEILDGLPAGSNRQTAEELVRLLVDLYGSALERVCALLSERAPELLTRLTEDELVESLMLVHELHPLDVDSRVQRALDRVRPYLGSHAGGVEYLGVDAAGVARLRLEGSCHGCPSSTVTVRGAIESALLAAAPEVTSVEVLGMVAPGPAQPLLQVGMGPPANWHAPVTAGTEPRADRTEWATLPELGPPTGRPRIVALDGVDVLICAVRGTLYAYRDACAVCGGSLADATLGGSVLSCASCGARFDVRLAGRAMDDDTHHLEPLPLLSDSKGTRVAVPKAVVP